MLKLTYKAVGSDIAPKERLMHPRETLGPRICAAVPETLHHLWTTGDWSDVTIIAGDTSFKVHKAILCPRSPFFATACKGDFSEAETGTIHVTEPDSVVKVVFEHIYDQELTLCKSTLPAFGADWDTRKLATMKTLVDAYVAADKYGVKDLQRSMTAAVKARLAHLKKPETVIALAEYTYNTTPFHYCDKGNSMPCAMRDTLVYFIHSRLKLFLLNTKAATSIMDIPELMFDLLGQTAEHGGVLNKMLLSSAKKRYADDDNEDNGEESGQVGGGADGCRRSVRLRGIPRRDMNLRRQNRSLVA